MSSVPANNLRGPASGDGDRNRFTADVADVLDRLRRIALLAAGAGFALLLLGLLIHRGRAFFQSYLYAAGNTATLSVWIGAFLVTALGTRQAAAR